MKNHNIKHTFKKAFTMLELVFVIVLIGIISAIALPSFDNNNVRQATDQVLNHIRYTQHLAMMDNRFDSSDATWYRERWYIRFTADSSGNGNSVYWIASDKDQDQAVAPNDQNEYAANPENSSAVLSGDSAFADGVRNSNMNLTANYGVTLTNNCSTNGRIFFDNMGRPLQDATFPATQPYQNLITADCNVTLTDGTTTLAIILSPETGYVRVQ